MVDAHKNLVYSTVATAPSPASSGTSLVVYAGDGTKFPAVPFNAIVWPTATQPLTTNAEIVRVTTISTDTFTIVRTQEGTSARSIVAGDQIAATITAKTITDIEAATTDNMYKNAIINANFDIWQRGTSLTLSDVTSQFLADRWVEYSDKNGGTPPTLTRSREILTSGDIDGAFYYTRLTTDGAGTSLGASSYHQLVQKIENGTRFLCGNGRTVTLSFWARSSVSNKRLGVFLEQNFGTGGSPDSGQILTGTIFTLTSTWAKYSYTFTTNSLVSRTFGTNNNDYLGLTFLYMWGSGFNSTYLGTSTSETYIGAGTTDITQVQISSGSTAPDFQPKSYHDELRMCQRYCYKTASLAVGASNRFGFGIAVSTTVADIAIQPPVTMRVVPTMTTSTISSNNFTLSDGVTGTNITALALCSYSARDILMVQATVASGLTQYRPYYLEAGNGNDNYFIFDAEL